MPCGSRGVGISSTRLGYPILWLLQNLLHHLLTAILGNGEAEEVDGDFVGRGVKDRGHSEMEGAGLVEHLISSTSQSSLHCYQIASTCPSNQERCFAIPRR